MKNIYVMKNTSFIGDYAFGDIIDPVNYGDAPTCNKCDNIIGPLEWLPPYRIKFTRGLKKNEPGDVIFGVFDDFMASQRFREIWEKEGLKGIVEWRPVEVVRGKFKGVQFFYPRLKPATARADFSRTKVAWNSKGPPSCQECLSEGRGKDAIKGIYLVENSIPNDDLFHAKGLTQIIASERFKQMAEKHGLLNVKLVKAEEYSWDPAKLFK